jgi:hypothetical protein
MFSEDSSAQTLKEGLLKRKIDSVERGGANKKAKAEKKTPPPVKELVCYGDRRVLCCSRVVIFFLRSGLLL